MGLVVTSQTEMAVIETKTAAIVRKNVVRLRTDPSEVGDAWDNLEYSRRKIRDKRGCGVSLR